MFCDRIRGSLTKDKERIMSSKNYIDVIIDGKIYNIGGFESEAYLQKVASYINNMIAEFKQNENYRVQKVDMQRILLEINIANDYFKAKKQADLLQNDIELKEKEVYDLKHELIVSDSKAETATKELNEALVSRFAVIKMPMISKDNLIKLIQDKFETISEQAAEEFANVFLDLQKKCENSEISSKALDIRGLLDSIALMEKGLEVHTALDMGITNKSFDMYEQTLIKDTIGARISKKIKTEDLFKK